MPGVPRLTFPAFAGRTAGIAALLGVAVAGCSSANIGMPVPKLSDMLTGEAARATPGASADVQETSCPSVDIRSGASTYSVSADPRDESAMNLRYQVSIATTARECRVVGGQMTIKVGVQGRVVIGPAGGPGQVDVPIRFAVVQEGIQPRPVATRFQRVSVIVPPDNANVLFTHVEDGLTFPLPRGNALDSYIVYVGFDPMGLRNQPRPVRRPPPRRSSS